MCYINTHTLKRPTGNKQVTEIFAQAGDQSEQGCEHCRVLGSACPI